MNDQLPQDTALRWVRVFTFGLSVDIQINQPVEMFMYRVRSTGYIQAPGCYVPLEKINCVMEIPAAGAANPLPVSLANAPVGGTA